jgi:hypothetical protein
LVSILPKNNARYFFYVSFACIAQLWNKLSKGRQSEAVDLFAYGIFMMLGILSKLPSGYILIVFGLFFINKKILIKCKLLFTGVSMLGLIPIIAW